jgi:hypothetical protein
VFSNPGFNGFALARISLSGQRPRHWAIFVAFEVACAQLQRSVIFVSPKVVIMQTGFVGADFGGIIDQ